VVPCKINYRPTPSRPTFFAVDQRLTETESSEEILHIEIVNAVRGLSRIVSLCAVMYS
jgi:hypothetical protein